MSSLRKYYLVFFSVAAVTIGGAANLQCIQCECCAHEQIAAVPEEISCCAEQSAKSEVFSCTLDAIPSCRCTIQSAQAVPFEPNRDLISFENKPAQTFLMSLIDERNHSHQGFSEQQIPGLVYGWSASAQSFLCRLNC